MGRYPALVGLLLIICTLSNAYLVVNSLDYVDVASAASYANLVNDSVYYVYPTTALHSAVLSVGAQEATLITSSASPVHTGYRNALETNGATITEEIISDDPYLLNLELASRSGTTSFVITDPDYTYNVVSLFAYARASGSYILFATKGNTPQVVSFLSSLPSATVLVYGSMDSSFLSSLSSSGISFEQIETGDKYRDNTEILKKYLASYDPQKQITFTDGSLLEPSITEGTFPVMLVSHTIPADSEAYLTSLVADDVIDIGVLVRDEYTGSVYNLMKTINAEYEEKQFSVFVKMGQASSLGGEMQPLAFYPLPGVVLEVLLSAVQYNTAKGEVELILENAGTVAAYTTSSVRVYSDGELIATVGDDAPVILGKGETKGISYPLTIDSPGELTANVTVYYSASRLAFEDALAAYVDMGTVDFADSSSLEITTATYAQPTDTVSIKLTNPGTEDVYFTTSVSYSSDLSSSSVSSPEVKSLSPGQSTVVQHSGLLITEEELPSLEMTATASYGGREEFLLNEVSAPVEIAAEEEAAEGGDSTLLLLAVILVVVVVAAYFFFGKKPAPTPAAPSAPAPRAPVRRRKK